MKIFSLLTALVVVSAFVSPALAQEPAAGNRSVFPTAEGIEWVYQAGQLEITERIAGKDQVAGEECLRIETFHKGSLVANEHIAVRADGVYRVAIAGELVTPPLCFLKFSAPQGTNWTIASNVAGEQITGKFRMEEAAVEVPAGKYRTVSVIGEDFSAGENSLNFTYYFAPGVGKVKQQITVNGMTTALELKEFKVRP